jgi:molecular chaperone DnaK
MRKLIGLGSDGRLVLKLPGGQETSLPSPTGALSCFLLLDCSGSMVGQKLEQARSGSYDFARKALSGGYSIGLIRFSDSAQLLCRPETDCNAIASVLSGLSAYGTTNMEAAIEMAAAELSGLAGTRALVVVTDGLPDNPARTLAAARNARSQGIRIITIGTENADSSFLRQLASGSDLVIDTAPQHLGDAISDAVLLLPDRTGH